MINSVLKAHPPTFIWPRLAQLPAPAKVLATAVIVALSFGMVGALGQIVVHDIIPTFFADQPMEHHTRSSGDHAEEGSSAAPRGDLFGNLAENQAAEVPRAPALHKQEQFVWLLKWSHIHLFGMSMIFLFLGGITIFLDLANPLKAWLVALPFIGVWLDIAAMWLKVYVSPLFFWLHLPGGGLFAIIFGFIAIRALWEMWGPERDAHEN